MTEVVKIGAGTVLIIEGKDKRKRNPVCIHGVGVLHKKQCKACSLTLLMALAAGDEVKL